MSEIINHILDFKLPGWVTVLLILITIVLSSPVITKLIETRNPLRSKSKKDLAIHPVFDYLNYSVFFRIKSLDFGDQLKNSIFHDMLIVMFNQYLNDLRSFIDRTNFDGNENEFKTKITILLHAISNAYVREWYNLNIPKPYFVIETYQRLNDKSAQLTFANIMRIYSSEIYDCDYERMDAILTILNVYCENLIMDAEATICQINGQLKGETYNSKF